MSWLARVVERVRSGRPATVVTKGLDYARQPDPGWQEMLDAETYAGDHVARLWLHWVPGDPWQPVHRWFLFQLQPWHYIKDEAVKQELRGPHPRTNAQLLYVPRVIDGQYELRPVIRGGPCRIIDRTQWVLHRELERRFGWKVFPRYFWVIQGEHGGHPYQVSDSEKMLRSAQGLPDDVPSAGDLPYAPFSPAVLHALRRHDLWRYAHGLGDPVTAHAAAQIRRQVETEQEANRLVWGHRETLAGEMADELSFNARKDLVHYHRWRPVGVKPRTVDYDRMRETYINDTTLEAAS